jgi:hypothetical protein
MTGRSLDILAVDTSLDCQSNERTSCCMRGYEFPFLEGLCDNLSVDFILILDFFIKTDKTSEFVKPSVIVTDVALIRTAIVILLKNFLDVRWIFREYLVEVEDSFISCLFLNDSECFF